MSYGGFFGDYEEDYYEPTLADEIFDEAKERLEEALRNDFKRKIQEAEEVLEKQEEIETKLFIRENKLNSRERELESKFRDIENEFAKKKLGEFMTMLQKYLGQTYYQVDSFGEYAPKCDACNDNRMLDVTLPDGSMKAIECSCNKRIYRYRVKEKEMIGFYIKRDGREQRMWLEYQDGSNETNSIYTTQIYEKFADAKDKDYVYKTFYTNKEEAQKHADYLNNKKEGNK